MRFIVFKIHLCGMSDGTMSRKIMIDKPFKTITKTLCLTHCIKNDITTVSGLICYIKREIENLSALIGELGVDNFTAENVYIKHKGYLIGLQHDKKISDIFDYFKKGMIEFDYIYVAGGASREYHGYKFIVHSNEEIHKNMPHVHVEKDNVAPRYDINTLQRFPKDKCTREHIRDEKKIIIPYLKKNKKWLTEQWTMSINGYIPPVENEYGRQYCKES